MKTIRKEIPLFFTNLLKELTKAVVYQQENKKKLVLGMIRENFYKGSPLNVKTPAIQVNLKTKIR